MGYFKLFNGVGSKQPDSNGDRIWDGRIDSDLLFDKRQKVAESKAIILLLNFVGVPLYVYTWVMNLDNFKGTILSILAFLFGISKLYFYWRRSFQAMYKEQQEAMMRELTIKREKESLNRERIENIERQLSIEVTGLTAKERMERDKRQREQNKNKNDKQ